MAEAECPVWMSTVTASEGGHACRFPALPLLLWLCTDIAGAILLSVVRATRPSVLRGAAQVVYCAWFFLLLPSHLAFRLVLLMHATFGNVYGSACGYGFHVCPRLAIPSTGSFFKDGVGFAMLLLGAFSELAFLLVFTGAWAIQADSWSIVFMICLLIWLLCCAGNAYYATWQGLFGQGPVNYSIGLLTPSVFRGNVMQLLFVHYALGTHPKFSDFARARESRRDAAFAAALYAMARPWLAPDDAIKELRSVLQDSHATQDSAQLEQRLKPLAGLLHHATADLSWQHDWLPAVASGGGKAVEVLETLGVVPTEEVVEAAVREASMHPKLTSDAVGSLLHACTSSGVSLDGLGERLDWCNIWWPATSRMSDEKDNREAHTSDSTNGEGHNDLQVHVFDKKEHHDLLLKLAQHNVRPTRSAFEAALRETVPLVKLEPMLRTLAISKDKLLQGLGSDLAWDPHWKPLVMQGYGELISLFVQHGITPSIDVVKFAIRHRAPVKTLEPLLASASSDELANLNSTFGWDDTWKQLLLDDLCGNPSQLNHRVDLLCAAGIVPSAAVIESAISALAQVGPIGATFSPGKGYSSSQRVRDLSTILPAAKRRIPLTDITNHLSWEEVWQPIASACDGAALMDILRSNDIVPSRKVTEAAIYSAAKNASRRLGETRFDPDGESVEIKPVCGHSTADVQGRSLATAAMERLFSAAACKGNTDGLGESLPWDVWAPAVAGDDAKWIGLLCKSGIRPSTSVIEAMFSVKASVACLQAAILPFGCSSSSSTSSPHAAKSDGGKPPFDMLKEATWVQIVERDDIEANAMAKLALSSTKQAPPTKVVTDAFASLCCPEVVTLFVQALVESDGKAADGSANAMKRLQLPREHWSKIVQSIAKAASEAAAVAAMACVAGKSDIQLDLTATGSKGRRAAALFDLALKSCEPPSPRHTEQLWSQAIQFRAPAAVRLLREHGYALPSTPRVENPSTSKSSAAATVEEPHRIEPPRVIDVTAGSLLRGAAKPPPAILRKRTRFGGVDGEATLAVRVPDDEGTLAVRASGAAGALLQAELMAELVKCTEVRVHLERHTQTDRDAPWTGDGDSTPRARAERVHGIAARLLGREALRLQGDPVAGASLPPVQPLPDLLSLETWAAGEASDDYTYELADVGHGTLHEYFRPFEGDWRRVGGSGRNGFRIENGLLSWPDVYQRPPTQLRVVEDGWKIELDIGDDTCVAILEEDPATHGHLRLVWSDGDVWTRESFAGDVGFEANADQYGPIFGNASPLF